MSDIHNRVPIELRVRQLSQKVKELQDKQWSDGFSHERSEQINEISSLLSAIRMRSIVSALSRESTYARD